MAVVLEIIDLVVRRKIHGCGCVADDPVPRKSIGRMCSAAQVPPFIRQIIMPDMHQSTHFAQQGVLNSHLGSAAITGSRNIQQRTVVP